MSTRIAKPHPRMRKQPRQARSRATVEAIIEAAAHVLSGLGWAGFTTNKVAETAGVSIGTLYQYFPDKLSLLAAVRRRHFDHVLSVIRDSAEDQKPLRKFAQELVRGMIAAHSIHPTLHQVLLDEAPGDRGSRAAHASFQAQYLNHYATAVATYRKPRKGADTETVARVLSSAIEGVIHNAARRNMLAAPELQKQLVELICAYLSGAGRIGR
ncbi:TetR/AcrR family transcriptional regulator [Mesorhizobium sp. ISC25]|uniref:TetR/AcrR family transcriptional regulator n=2 Tax=Mesorhizobium TaxID=68287 RepID=UPI0035D576BC